MVLPSNNKDLFVILTNHKYAKWATSFVNVIRNVENMSKIACLTVGNIQPEDILSLQNACTMVLPSTTNENWPSPHWYKLRMFVEPVFRQFERVRYADVDHAVKHGGIDWDAWVGTPSEPVGILYGGCNVNGGRMREFKEITNDIKHQFPASEYDLKGECLTTRVMVMETKYLPPVREMKKRVTKLQQEYPPSVFKYHEQGFIQMLFWNNTHYLKKNPSGLKHLYHMKCQVDKHGQCKPEQR